jgi:hypothetical protein
MRSGGFACVFSDKDEDATEVRAIDLGPNSAGFKQSRDCVSVDWTMRMRIRAALAGACCFNKQIEVAVSARLAELAGHIALAELSIDARSSSRAIVGCM